MHIRKKRFYLKNKLRFSVFLIITFLLSILLFKSIFTYNVKGHESFDYEIIVVSKGDTLWDIVLEHSNNSYDIRDEIYLIKKINNIKTSNIYPGQELMIPTRE